MKKVLIATTNKDKFDAVRKIFYNTIFPSDEFIIESLETLNINLPDQKEEGNNIERAIKKALFAKEYLKSNDFEYIVGLDDAIRIRGVLNPNVKENLNKILYEDYLSSGEEYSFSRAYAFVSKDDKIKCTTAEIPYIYKENKNIIIEEKTYPLAYVAYPIGYDVPINKLDEKQELEYYLKYVKDSLLDLNL